MTATLRSTRSLASRRGRLPGRPRTVLDHDADAGHVAASRSPARTRPGRTAAARRSAGIRWSRCARACERTADASTAAPAASTSCLRFMAGSPRRHAATRLRDRDAERLRRLLVHDELEQRRLLDRQSATLAPFRILSTRPRRCGGRDEVGAVGQQPPLSANARNGEMAGIRFCSVHSAMSAEWTLRIGDVSIMTACVPPSGARRSLSTARPWWRIPGPEARRRIASPPRAPPPLRSAGRDVPQCDHPAASRQDLGQQLEPLARQRRLVQEQAGDVAARPAQAADQTRRDGTVTRSSATIGMRVVASCAA